MGIWRFVCTILSIIPMWPSVWERPHHHTWPTIELFTRSCTHNYRHCRLAWRRRWSLQLWPSTVHQRGPGRRLGAAGDAGVDVWDWRGGRQAVGLAGCYPFESARTVVVPFDRQRQHEHRWWLSGDQEWNCRWHPYPASSIRLSFRPRWQ